MDKYIGESARLIREMFGYAKEHQVDLYPFYSLGCVDFGSANDFWIQPCVIFMDEIDAIGGRRFSEGTSADRLTILFVCTNS